MSVIKPIRITKKKDKVGSTEKTKKDQKILLELVKTDLRKHFGSLKRKMAGQEFKDMCREGWK